MTDGQPVSSAVAKTVAATLAPGAPARGARGERRLGAFLCWAVVFADIGTSVYYVPGILYGQVGVLAGLFVTLTLVVFILLTLKYAEVSVRFPQGGGVVTVAAHGIHPWVGALGGMLILVDYFLTAAISADSGLRYLGGALGGALAGAVDVAPLVLPLAVVVIALLGVLNWWGIRQSAIASLLVALVAFASDLVILGFVAYTVPMHAILQAVGELGAVSLRPVTLLTGFAGSFLAFSGLESVSQLAPVMRAPRRRTVTIALAFVAITVGLSSPLLTIFSTTLLTTCTPDFATCSPQVLQGALAAHGARPDPNQFISELAALAGGVRYGATLAIATAVAAAALLVFASNTAIIGAYHVVLALARTRFFPAIVERKSVWRQTPTLAIAVVTVVPIIVLVAVRGDIDLLGAMYAFGLLGAFTLTCVSLDVLRWRERRGAVPIVGHAEHPSATHDRGAGAPAAHHPEPGTLGRSTGARINFVVGILTTLLVGIAWATNLVTKPLATEFGGGVVALGLLVALAYAAYQRRHQVHPVFPTIMLRRVPHAVLVVLGAETSHAEQVALAACQSARGRPLVFLYLGEPKPRRVQRFQLDDPYVYDVHAKRAFSTAHRVCARAGRTTTYFVYSLAGALAVRHARAILAPEEIIAADALGAVVLGVAPTTGRRIEEVDGVAVAHYAVDGG